MPFWKTEEPMSYSLRKLIQKLGTAPVIEDETWKVVRCPSKASGGLPRYYAIQKTDLTSLLGKGANGIVYKAKQINAEGNTLLNKDGTEEVFAIKVVPEDKFNKSESEFQSRYFPMTESPVFCKKDNEIMLVGKYFPGKEVTNVYFQPNTELVSLSISQLFDITQQIIMGYNLMHNNTPSTGKAIIHLDIKGENIMLFIEKMLAQVFLFDFGLAKEIDLLSDEVFVLKQHGSLGYRAPEILQKGQASLKSDIYSLVPVIAYVFGAKDPCKGKDKNEAETRYNYRGMFNRFYLDQDMEKAVNLFYNFLDKMQERNPAKRPDMNMVLLFIATIRQFEAVCRESSTDVRTKNELMAKLILLASAEYSNQKIGVKEIEVLNRNGEKTGTILVDMILSDFDLNGSPEACAAIVQESANGKLLAKDKLYLIISKLEMEHIINVNPAKARDTILLNMKNIEYRVKEIACTGYRDKLISLFFNIYTLGQQASISTLQGQYVSYVQALANLTDTLEEQRTTLQSAATSSVFTVNCSIWKKPDSIKIIEAGIKAINESQHNMS